MTLIYMVRHAEAEGNLYRRAHGQYDSSLTPKGLRQLDALAERFRDTAVDALYSSDLCRTMATAAAVARYHPGLELQPDPRLREVDLGSWEDQPFGDLTYRCPEAMAAFNRLPFSYRDIDEANRLIRKGKDRTAVDVAATCRAWSEGARANYLEAERLAKQGR